MTPTPQIAHSSEPPALSSLSWYMASWARWNPPTPKWNTPAVSRVRL
jgi:hypothetical protein